MKSSRAEQFGMMIEKLQNLERQFERLFSEIDLLKKENGEIDRQLHNHLVHHESTEKALQNHFAYEKTLFDRRLKYIQIAMAIMSVGIAILGYLHSWRVPS